MSYKVLYIWLSEPSISCPTNSAIEYGNRSVEQKKVTQGGCFFPNGSLWRFFSTRLPLCSRGSGVIQTPSDPGGQGGFHSQAAGEFNQTDQGERASARSTNQRSGRRGFGAVAIQGKKSWLKFRVSDWTGVKFTMNTDTIVLPWRSWLKLTESWFLTRQHNLKG